jgi:quercetin dioxygenase-like cupin family protein
MKDLILRPVTYLALLAAQSVPTVGTVDEQKRLSPADIEGLPTIEAGAGTSGVSGIRTTVLAGNPRTSSPYTIMLEVPANTRIAAHTHRDARSAVVISGTWYFGYGPKAADTQTKALGPRSFYTEPANVAHFARTGTEPVVLYISGVGPTDTRYSAVEDAPRP